MSNPVLASRANPPVVFALFDLSDLHGVQAWCVAHQDRFLLKDPVLVTIEGKEKVWCFGTSAAFMTDQGRLQVSLQQGLAAQMAGGVMPAGAMPRLSRP